jgi:hypothetical protein
MYSMSSQKVRFLKAWNRNDFSLQFLKCQLQPRQIFIACKNREVDISAKFRSSVEHASLTAHQQVLDTMTLHRRKDSQCRVRVQGYLLKIEMFPTDAWNVPSAQRV